MGNMNSGWGGQQPNNSYNPNPNFGGQYNPGGFNNNMNNNMNPGSNFGMQNNNSYGGLDASVRTSIREILNGLGVAIKKDIEESQNTFKELLRMRGESKLLE